MKKNDTVKLNIEKTSFDGRGIGYIDGKIAFVSGTLEGETVTAKIYTVHNSYITAGAVEIISPSPLRCYGYCDVSENYHKIDNKLKCHYCGKRFKALTKCPECGKSAYGRL